MSNASNEFAFSFDVMKKAAETWRQRTPSREHEQQLLKEKRYTAVEPKERLAKRVNRLLDKVKESLPLKEENLSTNLRDLVQRGPISESEISDFLVERVIGETRDFLSVAFFEGGEQATKSVGRIITQLGGGRVSFGTGFLVSPHLLITNRHVLTSAADASQTVVEFNYQPNTDGIIEPESFELKPEIFFSNNEDLDFALVAVSPTSSKGKTLSDYGWLRLIKEEGKVTKGNCLNIIQHPLGGMKQVVIRENQLVDLFQTKLQYEGDTEPGSSGSPVFNDQWEVVGLHHSGIAKMDKDGNFLDANGNIWKEGDDPSRLVWTANEGIRVSSLVEYISQLVLEDEAKKLRDELLSTGNFTEASTATKAEVVNINLPAAKKSIKSEKQMKPAVNSIDVTNNSATNGSVTITVPLNITISLGNLNENQSASFNVPSQIATPTDDAVEKVEPDQNYNNRPGFDPDFLGFSAPLPKLMPSIRSLAVEVPGLIGNNPYELKYYHYSVIMNGQRRIAFVSAVNYDANSPTKFNREKGDQWFFDPRISKDYQAGNELYANNPFDRGHLTRRADAAWGDTEADAKLANDDTFHFTNCSTQHEIFNQPAKAQQMGLLLWGTLEDYVATQAKNNNEKLSVFNGPILRPDDTLYRGYKVPREFYKIVVFKKDNDQPCALAFLLSQDSLIKDVPTEDFVVGPYKPYQVRIQEIESKTKLDFGLLRTYDPLQNEEHESFFSEGMDAIAIDRIGNIRF